MNQEEKTLSSTALAERVECGHRSLFLGGDRFQTDTVGRYSHSYRSLERLDLFCVSARYLLLIESEKFFDMSGRVIAFIKAEGRDAAKLASLPDVKYHEGWKQLSAHELPMLRSLDLQLKAWFAQGVAA